MLVIPLLLGLTRTLGSPVGEEGHRRSVRLRIETSYEFYLSTLPYLYHLFAEDEQTSEHGGGGRYNAI
jgi:hypothetical protein